MGTIGVLLSAMPAPGAGPDVTSPVAVPSPAPGPPAARPVPRSAAAQVRDTAPDAAERLEEARDRQRSFERTRRWALPLGRSSGESCDEVIGRYCLWHENDPDWTPHPEPEEVKEERRRLLRALERAEAANAGSDWVVGQRVRYLVQAGRAGEALAAARGCRATRWWCRALEGYALHRLGRYEAAETTFETALSIMPGEDRRDWTDLEWLLDGDAEDEYDDADRAARDRLAEHAWWLADPLYLVAGNERRTEHLARWVADRMYEDASSPFGPFWGDDLGELLVRYGEWEGFERVAPSPNRPGGRPDVIAHQPQHAQQFFPTGGVLTDPTAAPADAWRLDDAAPQATFAPAYTDSVRPLAHQVAVFRRRDSARVVATYRLDADPDPEGDADADDADTPEPTASHRDTAAAKGVEALLYLSESPGSGAVERRRRGGATGTLVASLPARPHLLSLEALRRDSRVAARARFGLVLRGHPEGVPGISDLLLFRPAAAGGTSSGEGGGLPSDLEEAIERARPPGALRPGERVGLFWELYGPSGRLAGMEISVAVGEADGGWLRTLADRLGLGEGAAGVEWRDRPLADGRIHPRALVFTLPPSLEPGEYELEVAVRLPGYDPLVARRPVEVREEERTAP